MVPPAAVQIMAGRAVLEGDLTIPVKAAGLVVFAHGSGSSRFSRRNRSVAQVLQAGGYATLLLDLLTRQEDVIDEQTGEYRFDVDRLGHRVVAAIDWTASHPQVTRLPVACFGASTSSPISDCGYGIANTETAASPLRNSVAAYVITPAFSGRLGLIVRPPCAPAAASPR